MEQEKKIRREIANSNERRRMQSINAGFNSLRTMLPKYDNEKLSKAAILQHTAEYIDQLEQDKTRFLQEIREIKKLLNPELLELHQKSLQEQESKLDKQPFKRMRLEVINPLDLSNSESSDEGIQLGASSPKQENQQQISNQLALPISDKKTVLLTATNHVNNNASPITTNGCTVITTNTSSSNHQINHGKSNQLINGKFTNDMVIDCDDIDVLRAELVQVRKVLDKERKLRMKLEEQVRELEAQLYPTRIKEIAQQVQLQYQGIDLYQQPQIMKENIETEAAISSVLVSDAQHEMVAQTVEIGAEIEAQDCSDSSCHDQIQPLISSSQSNIFNHHSQLLTLNASNVSPNLNTMNLPSTTYTIIQDLANQNTVDSIDNQSNVNGLSEKMVEADEEVVTNKILTSSAYLTTTSINNKVSSKFSSSKNYTQKSDKNTGSQSTSGKLSKTTSGTSSSMNNHQHLNSNNNNKINSSIKKSTTSSCSNDLSSLSDQLTTTTSQLVQSSDLESCKKDKQHKKSSAAVVALPIDVPFIYDPTTNSTNSLEQMTSNKINDSSSIGPCSRTVTVQIIDGNLTSSIDNVPVITTTTTASGRNNNLNTILEAICHLEGDMFGNDKELNEHSGGTLAQVITLQNHDSTIVEKLSPQDSNKTTTTARPGVIVSSSNN